MRWRDGQPARMVSCYWENGLLGGKHWRARVWLQAFRRPWIPFVTVGGDHHCPDPIPRDLLEHQPDNPFELDEHKFLTNLRS